MDLKREQIQFTLDLDVKLTERYRSVKEAIAAGVYRNGLKRTAGELDVAPGNLSVMLSGDGARHLDVDLLERYVESTGDKTPIYYLVAKHCQDTTAEQTAKLEELQRQLASLPALLAALTDHKSKKKGR
ncbi:MAG TPA: hypothetical protein VF389_10085 [Woeseiaceae bacterium]